MMKINLQTLQNLSGYFHDGSIIDIRQTANKVEISMQSAEITENLNIPLSEHNRIKGILTLDEVESIACEGTQFFKEKLSKPYDSGNIFDFIIDQNVVELSISWRNFRPKPLINEFSTLIIKAKSISWETTPDLLDPNW